MEFITLIGLKNSTFQGFRTGLDKAIKTPYGRNHVLFLLISEAERDGEGILRLDMYVCLCTFLQNSCERVLGCSVPAKVDI